MPGHIWGTSTWKPAVTALMGMACMLLGFIAECVEFLSVEWYFFSIASTVTFLIASFYFATFFFDA